MEKADLLHHISRQFNYDLARVFARAVRMAELVERQYAAAIRALVTADRDLAQAVVRRDDEVNEADRELQAECQRLLAVRAPAASDLRMLFAMIKAIGDIERMGDECKKIALLAAQLTPDQVRPRRFREIRHLAAVVQEMIGAAREAYERLDADAAREVMKMDWAIDREYESIQRQCVTYMMEDRAQIRRALDDMWTIRALERVGDHAKNLCEYVIYVVHGKDIRHTASPAAPT